MSEIQFGVIMMSHAVEVMLYNIVYIESSPDQRSIILLQPYKILERLLDKQKNYTSFKKDPRFF